MAWNRKITPPPRTRQKLVVVTQTQQVYFEDEVDKHLAAGYRISGQLIVNVVGEHRDRRVYYSVALVKEVLVK